MRFFQRSSHTTPGKQVMLGELELSVLQILWTNGRCNVRDVVEKLDRKLAYTTVMTTLDRLFKKGLLERQKADRAFLYAPRFSRPEWDRQRAGDLVAGFLEGPSPSRELLLSSLLDAVGQHDPSLLDALEEKIKAKRREITKRSRP